MKRSDQLEALRQKNIRFLKDLNRITCLNPEDYKHSDSYLNFKCHTCHQVKKQRYAQLLDKIRNNKCLCAICGRKKRGFTTFLKFLPKKINQINLLGLKYISYEIDERKRTFIKIQCECGHEFKKNYKKIHELKFCPQCRPKSMIEELCRQTLIFLFQIQFYSIRPHFMRNEKTNQPLELDCYSEIPIKLKDGGEKHISVEIDGGQHDKFNKHFHKTRKRFNQQKKRDILKEEICKDKNIYLIRVKISQSDYGNIPNVIKKVILSLEVNNVTTPTRDFTKFKINQQLGKNPIKNFKNLLDKRSFSFIKINKKNQVETLCPKGHLVTFEKHQIKECKNRCLICAKENLTITLTKNKKKTYEKIKGKISKHKGVLNTPFDDFIKQDSQKYSLSVTCPKHDYTWNLLKSNLDRGKWCKFCGFNKASKKQKVNFKAGLLVGLNSKSTKIKLQ